jgi:hypothetical protein
MVDPVMTRLFSPELLATTWERLDRPQWTCFNDDPMRSCNDEVVALQILVALGLVVVPERCDAGHV